MPQFGTDSMHTLRFLWRFSRAELEPKLKLELDKQSEKVLYLQVDKSVPTGQTVELIGMAKANQWKIMLGSNPASTK